jgi:hypothetical protein
LIDSEKLKTQISSRYKEIQDVHQKIKVSEHILEVLYALDRTPRMKDPGKDGMAAWFVDSSRKLIKDETTIALTTLCKECSSVVPIIVTYYQTYDSMDGDTWRTQAVTICVNEHFNILKQKFSDMRGIYNETVLENI